MANAASSSGLKIGAYASAVVLFLSISLMAYAQNQPSNNRLPAARKYADPIPNPLTPPDPCDNPTVKRWGPKDQRGNMNFLTPAKVVQALKLVKEGRLIRLDHLWEPGRNGVLGNIGLRTMRGNPPAVPPADRWFGITTYELLTNRIPAPGTPQANSTLYGAVNQQGAEIDAWNHMGHKNGVTYNCFNLLDDNNLFSIPDPNDATKTMFSGYKAMGVDSFGSIITRGILLDVFAYKKEQSAAQGQDVTDFPPNGTVYTSEDLEDTMVKQGLKMSDFEPGDVIYVRTGNAYRWWTEDPEKPRDDRQGFFASLAAGGQVNDRGGQWVVNRNAIAYGSDTNGGPHSTLMPQGVTLIEDLDLELLAKDAAAEYARTRDAKRSYIFTTIVQPLRCRGCSGSAVAPVAVR